VPSYRASGVTPPARTRSDTSSTPAAPSFSGEELPPVTVPPLRNAGRLAASSSRVSPGRMPSSCPTGPAAVGTGTISSSNRPASRAAPARWWLRSANPSCRSRLTP
jgi:hypothetical protein